MDSSLQVVSDVVERAIDSGRLPGAVLAVERGDRLLCLNAWGDQQPGSASMTVDALFRIYSMTKPITSVAVLMLLERAALRPLRSGQHVFARIRVSLGRPRNR